MKARFPFFWIVLPLALLAAGAWFFREPFHRWQQRRLLAASQAFFQRGDFRSACLSARQALQNDPHSVQACMILARVADAAHSPEAVLWREKLVEITPGKSGALLDLAAAATRLGETFVAEQALAQVNGRDRDTLAFHQIAGALAVAAKQFDAADDQFQKALQLEPQNESLQLNLATLRLGAAKGNLAAESRAVLERLKKNPQLHRAATHALLSDARKCGDAARSMELAAELHQNAAADIDDHLCFLEELQRAQSAKFDGELRALQTKTGTGAGTAYALMTWMNAHDLAAQTIGWSASLPANVRGQMPVPLAVAEAYTSLREWHRLREIVADADWGELNFLRYAIHARVIDETSDHEHGPDFKLKWDRAIITTHNEPTELSMLARLVGGWGWKTEAEQVWWRVANSGAGQRPALKALYKMYADEKNTRELYRVNRRIFQIEPSNPVTKNNVAALALLLGEDMAEAHRFAEENFRMAPDDPTIASTRAYSLYLQKRTREAVEILARLPESVLKQPSLAAYYGAFLAADGDREKAEPFLEIAARQKQELLPEELALVDAALKQP